DNLSALANTASQVLGNIYYSVSFVYPALAIALIRGPFSIAGVHESAIQISSSTA
ncbi:hypothetical protein H0H93_006011, partial [Arthromyces matolae]